MNLFDSIFKEDYLDRIAILYEQRRITYSELRHETLAIKRVLNQLSVAQGDRVALLLNDSPEFVAAFIAICTHGAIVVPINMALRLEEQQAILNNCTASLAFIEADLSDALLPNTGKLVPELKQIVVVNREEKAANNETDEFFRQVSSRAIRVRALADLIRESADRSLQPQPDLSTTMGDGPAFILYTSGSTGEPKGAVHRQSDIFFTNETYCRQVLRLRDGDRLFSSSRLPFAYGLGNAFTFPLLNGCTTILCREKPTAEIVRRVFADYKPTIFFAVPVVYRLILDDQKTRQTPSLDCSSLRLCVSAGEALPAQIGEEWEEVFQIPVLDGIGSTEMLHMWMSNHEGEVVYGSSGRLLRGYEARLLDPEGRPTPVGKEGNLWVRGASAAIGYWERPETTAVTFVDGWVRTGDLYRQDFRDYWFHMGRSDDCFKSSGQWVSPVEVEGVLLRHEGVNRTAVVEDFDEVGLPCPCAFVVRTDQEDDRDLEQSLRELARSALPRHKQPRRYIFVSELPYTATGKIQRFKLREQLKQTSAAIGRS